MNTSQGRKTREQLMHATQWTVGSNGRAAFCHINWHMQGLGEQTRKHDAGIDEAANSQTTPSSTTVWVGMIYQQSPCHGPGVIEHPSFLRRGTVTSQNTYFLILPESAGEQYVELVCISIACSIHSNCVLHVP